jgi:imidazolonepropionase-like amidohydrolase
MSMLAIKNASIVSQGNWGGKPTSVLIVNGRVAAIGAAVEVPSAANVIDAQGGSLLPGLIDAHCHAYGASMSLDDLNYGPMSYIAFRAQERLGRALRRGFTTVRDVAGGDLGLARAINEKLIAAPRYLYTGPALSQTGGHGDGRDPLKDYGAGHCGCNTMVVDGVDPIRHVVRDLLRKGSHAIKMMTSGGVISPTDPLETPQYSPEEIQVAVAEAARRGTYVTAHCYSSKAIAHSVENGIRCIEHGNLLDAPTAKKMAQTGTFLVPTLAAYEALATRGTQFGLTEVGLGKNSLVLDAGKEAIRLARAANVRIGFGSDLMAELEDEQLNGLRLQAEVEGIERTIEAATATNAELLRLSDVGQVKENFVADLLLLPGDVVKNPDLLWAGERTVIQAGVVVSQ